MRVGLRSLVLKTDQAANEDTNAGQKRRWDSADWPETTGESVHGPYLIEQNDASDRQAVWERLFKGPIATAGTDRTNDRAPVDRVEACFRQHERGPRASLLRSPHGIKIDPYDFAAVQGDEDGPISRHLKTSVAAVRPSTIRRR